MKAVDIPYWRLSSFYFFYFAFLGAWVPFWNLYLEQGLGYSAKAIGAVSALVLATKIIGPSIWGWLADHFGHRMAIIRWGSLLAALVFSGVFFRTDLFALLLVVGGYSFFWNAVLAQFEVVTLSHLREQAVHYTRIRLWGSVGFIIAVFGLGWLFDVVSISYLPYYLLAMLTGIWLCSLIVNEVKDEAIDVVERSSGSSFQSFIRQLRQPQVLVFFLLCFLAQFSHGPYYTFYTIYLEQLGYQRLAIGGLWSLGVAAEVVLFIFMPGLLHRFSLQQLMLATLLLTGLRWLMIAWWADVAVVLVFAQLFHAASFGSFHAVAIEAVRRFFPAGSRGQGQAFYSAISFGAGGALGALLSGWCWQWGAQLLFVAAGVSVLAGLLVALWVGRRYPPL